MKCTFCNGNTRFNDDFIKIVYHCANCDASFIYNNIDDFCIINIYCRLNTNYCLTIINYKANHSIIIPNVDDSYKITLNYIIENISPSNIVEKIKPIIARYEKLIIFNE